MSVEAARRFDRIASNYATSEVHQRSATITRLHALLSRAKVDSVVDVACGAGHLALSFAGRAKTITGVDPSPAMLDQFRAMASARETAVEVVQAMSDTIPLPSRSADLCASRLAPHHFKDIERSLQEMRRIAAPGGVVAVIDLHGDEDDEIDDFNHTLELLHDPTHVRSHKPSVWQSLFETLGLELLAFEPCQRESEGGVTIQRWCEIASSGDHAEGRIRELLGSAPTQYLDALGIGRRGDGEFLIPVRTVLVVGRVPALVEEG